MVSKDTYFDTIDTVADTIGIYYTLYRGKYGIGI